LSNGDSINKTVTKWYWYYYYRQSR